MPPCELLPVSEDATWQIVGGELLKSYGAPQGLVGIMPLCPSNFRRPSRTRLLLRQQSSLVAQASV